MALEHDVQNDFEVISVQLIKSLHRVRKCARIPREFAVVGIPAVGTETGTEIDHGVAWQFLFAEQLRLRKNLRGSYPECDGIADIRTTIAEASREGR